MSVKLSGPVVPRRRIARELKQLREGLGLRLEQVAEESDVSTSTLSRLENAQGTANPLTIKALVNFYKIADTERGRNLVEWARDGRKPGWWQGYRGVAQEINPSYVAYETQAAEARMYLIPFFPTLFQTYDYARELSTRFNPDHSADDVAGLVDLRQERKKILHQRDGQAPLRVRAILHEICLTQLVGSAEVMRAQLHELLELIGTLPETVSVRIMERTAPPHRAMQSPWVQFVYPDDVGIVSFFETDLELKLHEATDEMERVATDFEELSGQSLDEQRSVAFIERVLAQEYR